MQAFADPKSDDAGETESPFEEDPGGLADVEHNCSRIPNDLQSATLNEKVNLFSALNATEQHTTPVS